MIASRTLTSFSGWVSTKCVFFLGWVLTKCWQGRPRNPKCGGLYMQKIFFRKSQDHNNFMKWERALLGTIFCCCWKLNLAQFQFQITEKVWYWYNKMQIWGIMISTENALQNGWMQSISLEGCEFASNSINTVRIRASFWKSTSATQIFLMCQKSYYSDIMHNALCGSDVTTFKNQDVTIWSNSTTPCELNLMKNIQLLVSKIL